MKFGLRKLIIAMAVVALILTALRYCSPPRIQWLRYDAAKVKQSIDAGENVLVYFRGRPEDTQHRTCNPENTLSYVPVINALRSKQVRCFLADAWKANSPAQQEVIRLTGEVPEFQLAAYTRGDQEPILLDDGTFYGTQLEQVFPR